MRRFLLALALAFLGLIAMLIFAQRSFMYFPHIVGIPDIAHAPWMNEFKVTTSDGLTLKAWFVPPRKNKPTIIFFHGNGSNVEMTSTYKAPYLINAGYGILAAEYRGYSGNPGKPTEEGLYKDARAQIDWLAKEHNIKEDDRIIYGESIGSGVAVQMATEYNAKALILDVPFSSALDIAKAQFFFVPFLSKLMKDKYMNHEKIGKVYMPVLIGIGGRDHVVPMRFGKKLFKAANEPKILKIYDNASHMGLYEYGFHKDAIDFIEEFTEGENK